MPKPCPVFQNARFPTPADMQQSANTRDRWLESVRNLDNKRLSSLAESICAHPEGQKAINAMFGNSPYLSQVCVSDPGFSLEALEKGPDQAIETIHQALSQFNPEASDFQTLAEFLRLTKNRHALTVAMADIAELWPLEKITDNLSRFAEASLQLACRHILNAAIQKGVLSRNGGDDSSTKSGFIVLAMGKLGSRELNYSSDIDLIVFFDPDRMTAPEPEALQKHCIRMTRDLVRIMDERSSSGYVFRTDLRLRPDPGATPLAVSLRAAEIYYESQGQNWERAAMIKARAIAGDREAGEQFIRWLRPFVWRKNLDFAAIQDIHSIKRQINAKRGGSIIELKGHNIKLGRGGIREIEFFAQTQQLIWGGRIKALRTPSTVSALNALYDHGQIERQTADDLINAYEYLRKTEHRLQMINDEQTQTLPYTPEGLNALATFMGYTDPQDFQHDIKHHLRLVEDHYARLFADAPALTASGSITGNLVFTGSDSDPDTLDTIATYGFQNPEAVDAAIRAWHHGRYRAMRSSRAREMLTELTPALLKTIGETLDPDGAFLKMDEFLAGLPAGVQLFSMLHTNPQLLKQLATILGEAPRLAEQLGRRPSLFDSILSSDFLDPPPKLSILQEQITEQLDDAGHFEQALDTCRRWVNERKFQIGLQSLHGKLSPPKAAWALSDTATAAISSLFPLVEREFAQQHGYVPGARFCVLAYGKLGSHEMTPTSDLDMVFIYDLTDPNVTSDGQKALMPSQYFGRLAQRYINAVSAPTAEGTLYDIDMRLRPAGSSGPIACTLEAFTTYQRENAWTWERLALTRARPLYGDDELCRAVADALRITLCQSMDPETLRNDIATMRLRMDQEHHTESVWSIKHVRGGLVDLEFIVQYLILRYAPEYPDILSTNTWRSIRNLESADILNSTTATSLLEALDLWQALQSRLHLTIETDAPPHGLGSMPLALQEKLIQLGGGKSVGDVEAILKRATDRIFDIFLDQIGLPTDEYTTG